MTLKSYDEMTPEQQMAYRLGQASAQRCRICPAVTDEEHCEKCHAVHQRSWEEIAEATGRGRNQSKPLAQRVLAGLEPEQVNTEVVNQ